uniref:Possible DNA helicase n=1 Tax=Streptomyces fradiae TaxID=1906 RepID=Q45R65_STRFR|nr:possible DNA helicase [Streptomyces fradiae]
MRLLEVRHRGVGGVHRLLVAPLDELEVIGSPNGSGPTGIKTGFTDLDALTGSLYPGQLIVIAGRPAMGATTLTLDILRSTALQQGLPSALFSLEMRSLDLTMRVMSAEARIPLHHMRSGAMTDDDWTRLSRRMPDISAAPLFLQDDDYSSFSDLRAHARRLHARHGVRLIAVDDLQHLPYGTRRLASRYEEVSEIARGLKRMAKELQIPVIAVSTLNRGAEQRPDKRLLLSDLRDSGALEDNADLVILSHREDAYQRDTPRRRSRLHRRQTSRRSHRHRDHRPSRPLLTVRRLRQQLDSQAEFLVCTVDHGPSVPQPDAVHFGAQFVQVDRCLSVIPAEAGLGLHQPEPGQGFAAPLAHPAELCQRLLVDGAGFGVASGAVQDVAAHLVVVGQGAVQAHGAAGLFCLGEQVKGTNGVPVPGGDHVGDAAQCPGVPAPVVSFGGDRDGLLEQGES